MKTGETRAVNATVSLFYCQKFATETSPIMTEMSKTLFYGGVPMEYVGQALVAMAIIITAVIAIVWAIKTVYVFITKSRKEVIKHFEEPLKNLINNCVKMSDALCKITTKELEKMNSDEDND